MFYFEDCRHHRRVVWPWGFGVEKGMGESMFTQAQSCSLRWLLDHLKGPCPFLAKFPQYSISDPTLILPPTFSNPMWHPHSPFNACGVHGSKGGLALILGGISTNGRNCGCVLYALPRHHPNNTDIPTTSIPSS
jgi:hypothetical protein